MDFLSEDEFLGEIKTLEDRDLILSEIESLKRRDTSSVRKEYLGLLSKFDLNDLTKKLKEMEVIRVTLAIYPTVGILEIVDKFLKENLKQKVVIDFDLNKEIIGGMQIVYQGKYCDMSAMQKIKQKLS
ncbi:MAG: F0F1 ATP synthase subunit delta [Patescibacteria group bacterium]